MASEDQHSSEFKARVALEALAQDKKNLDRLSDKYDVPVSVILIWAVQLERNAGQVYATTAAPSDIEMPGSASEETIVDVEISDPDISESVGFGAMHDDLDYKTLFYWSGIGLAFIIIFAQLIKFMYDQSGTYRDQQVNNQTVFYQVENQKQEARNQISTFGVVNLEEGTYKIPIDLVLDQMAVDKDSTSTSNTQ